MSCLAQFLGCQPGKCGYCEGVRDGQKENIGGFFINISPEQYEQMLCHQWRRCGQYYYQPQNDKTCCPQYTIRLDCTRCFLRSRSHKRVLRIMSHWLQTGERRLPKKKQRTKVKKTKAYYDRLIGDNFRDLTSSLSSVVQSLLEGGDLIIPPEIPVESLASFCRLRFNFLSRDHPNRGQLLLDLPLALAGRIRSVEKKRPGTGVVVYRPSELAQKIVEAFGSPAGIRRIEAQESGHIEIWLSDPGRLCMGDEDDEMSVGSDHDDSQDDDVDMVPDASAEEGEGVVNENDIMLLKSKAKFDHEEWLLYRKYQMIVHKDPEEDLTEKGFTRFLCNSSLVYQIDPNLPLGGYGTFHIQYRVRHTNQLLAVSVVDVLPHGLSSVYFFYDPDFNFLSLGVWSALRELEMMKETAAFHPEFKYYYLGFYVHSCQKMRYKGQFRPSELLCNETWQWVDLEQCKTVLDVSDYGRFAPSEEEPGEDALMEVDEDEIPDDSAAFGEQMIFLKRVVLPFSVLKHIGAVLKPASLEKLRLFRKILKTMAPQCQYYIDDDDLVTPVDPRMFLRRD